MSQSAPSAPASSAPPAVDYADLRTRLAAVLDGVSDPVAAMATCSCLVKESLPKASWVGFYRVVEPRLLRIGPYQGPLGCLEIPFDRGVCGAAAREEATQLVEDVHAFPGHIACDAGARSEIVVPVHDAGGRLVAVLDVDSHQAAAFTEADREGLEGVVEVLRGALG